MLSTNMINMIFNLWQVYVIDIDNVGLNMTSINIKHLFNTVLNMPLSTSHKDLSLHPKQRFISPKVSRDLQGVFFDLIKKLSM